MCAGTARPWKQQRTDWTPPELTQLAIQPFVTGWCTHTMKDCILSSALSSLGTVWGQSPMSCSSLSHHFISWAPRANAAMFWGWFCCSVTKWSLTLRPHGLQRPKLPCPSLSQTWVELLSLNQLIYLKIWDRVFPGDPGKESSCQRMGHGFDPWSQKIPHATEQLILCTATIEHRL